MYSISKSEDENIQFVLMDITKDVLKKKFDFEWKVSRFMGDGAN